MSHSRQDLRQETQRNMSKENHPSYNHIVSPNKWHLSQGELSPEFVYQNINNRAAHSQIESLSDHASVSDLQLEAHHGATTIGEGGYDPETNKTSPWRSCAQRKGNV